MFGLKYVLRASAVVQSVREVRTFRHLLWDLDLVRDVGCVWVKVRTSGISCASVCERCRGVYGPKIIPRTSAVGVQSVSLV